MNTTFKLFDKIETIEETLGGYDFDCAFEKEKYDSERQTIIDSFNEKIDVERSVYISKKERHLEDFRSFKSNIEAEKNKILSYKTLVGSYYNESRINLTPGKPVKFNVEKANVLVKKIDKEGGSLLAIPKIILTFGKYDKEERLISELFSMINDGVIYLDNQIIPIQDETNNKVKKETINFNNRKSEIEKQRDEELLKIKAKYDNRIESINSKRVSEENNDTIKEINRIIADSNKLLGVDKEGWESYKTSKVIPNEILFGKIAVPIKGLNTSTSNSKVLDSIICYNKKNNIFAIPLTFSTDKPVKVYSETMDSNTNDQALIFSSFVERAFRFMPLKSVKASFIDPINRGSSLGLLKNLTNNNDNNICEAFLDNDSISTEIERIKKHVDKICDVCSRNSIKDIYEYNSGRSEGRFPYYILVINDYPNGFDTKSLNDLDVIINQAEKCGVSILISHKKDDELENKSLEIIEKSKNKFIQHMEKNDNSDIISIRGKQYKFKGMENGVKANYFNEMNSAYNYEKPISNSFESFYNLKKLPQLSTAVDGLKIPFAVDEKGELVELVLNGDTLQYVFITGQVGSGKSELLHTLITSAALNYSTEELEMWIADFKETEFYRYEDDCPNQIRYNIANQSSEIAFDIIDKIHEELNRRKKVFYDSGKANDFKTYRKTQKMARLLVVIDEFHRVSQAVFGEIEYKEKLENIVAEGRSHGISLIFCDQMISEGLNGFTPKARDMFSVRIALRNNQEEVKETLNIKTNELSEEVRRNVNRIASAKPGSLMFKCETQKEDKTNTYYNKIEYLYCRGLHIEREIQKEFIKANNDRLKKLGCKEIPKNSILKTGRKEFINDNIELFEKDNSLSSEEIERYHIGIKPSLNPLFYFRLKKDEQGENLVIVGKDGDKGPSIIKAIVNSGVINGRDINILVSKNSSFYNHYSDYLRELKNAFVHTSPQEIYKFVKKEYDQITNNHPRNEGETTSPFTIIVGLNHIIEEMERSNKVEKTNSGLSEHIQKESEKRGKEILDSIKGIDNSEKTDDIIIDETEDPFSRIESNMDVFKFEEMIKTLLSSGWEIGINQVLLFESMKEYKDKRRQIGVDNYCNHKVALKMTTNDASDFLGKYKVMNEINEQMDEDAAIYQYMGGREQKFFPYLFE